MAYELYQLYRLAANSDDHADAVLLGTFAGFGDALAARDRDTVSLFAATPAGQVMTVHHDIVGPGVDGPATTHPLSTGIERRGHGDPDEVAAVRGWLARIHAFTG